MSADSEISVSVTSDELEAEIIKGLLESEGIPARIAYRSRYGLPRSWTPTGLGYPSGSFEVFVRREDADEARELVAPPQASHPSPPKTSTVVSVIASVALIWWLIGMAIPLGQWLSELMGSE